MDSPKPELPPSQVQTPNESDAEIEKALEGVVEPEKKERVKQIIRAKITSAIPFPAQLAEYEKICPGSAKIFLENFHRATEHKMQLEKDTLTANVNIQKNYHEYQMTVLRKEENSKRFGMLLAGLVGIAVAVCMFAAIDQNQGAWAAGICGVLAATVVVFRYTRNPE